MEFRMARVEKVSIALTPEFAASVREAVSSGEYASNSEVVRDALRAWTDIRRARAVAINELRTLWRNGLDNGEPAALDAEDIKRRGRGRLAELRAKQL
jgi:antitoxin ParD1/3/4